jgi:glycosyltransferase involved in cell wall biosynthesis
VLQIGSPAGMFGAERWILALAKHLPADQVQTIVGVIQDEKEKSTEEVPLCVHARELGFETMAVHAPGKLSRSAIPQLREFIRKQQIDILHTHFYKPTILGALAVRGTRCKLLATPHGWNTDAGIKLQAYEWLERIAFGWVDAVAPLSRDLETGLKRLPWLKGKVHFIQNGVDLSEVTASTTVAPEVQAARDRGEFVVGYIGQLIPRKRVDTLIKAFAQIDGTSKRLFIVGDGEQRYELESLVNRLGMKGHVEFKGFRNDRLDFLRGFDVLVLPSALEGIPRCLMEGMAAGIPVIGTDIPGVRDLIKNGESGGLIKVGDQKSLLGMLLEKRLDDDKNEKIICNALLAVKAKFSAHGMSDQYFELFNKLKK